MRKKRREDLLPETRFHLARTQILLFAALTGFNLLLFTLFPGIRRLFASELAGAGQALGEMVYWSTGDARAALGGALLSELDARERAEREAERALALAAMGGENFPGAGVDKADKGGYNTP